MPSVTTDKPHPQLTRRRKLTYVFTPKHHGGNSEAACWLPEISLDDEFAIFDKADGNMEEDGVDHRQVADRTGTLYGYKILTNDDLHLMILGKWGEQLSEYPDQKVGQSWHGYPIYPVGELGPENRRGDKCRPDKAVFVRMRNLGDITAGQSKRLMKGDHI